MCPSRDVLPVATTYTTGDARTYDAPSYILFLILADFFATKCVIKVFMLSVLYCAQFNLARKCGRSSFDVQ